MYLNALRNRLFDPNAPSNPPDGNTPPDDSGVPDVLKGKTPAEIVAFFAERENTIKTHYEAKLADATPAAPAPAASNIKPGDFWTDPVRASEQTARTIVAEEFTKLSKPQQANMIAVAELLASNKFKDWSRYAADVKKTMAFLPDAEQANSVMWETTYWHIKGLNADKLFEEGMHKGKQMSSEPVGNQPPDPTKPPVLAPVEAQLARGFGLSDDQWRAGQKQIKEGTPWPMAGLK
jgi:hypothetical protein